MKLFAIYCTLIVFVSTILLTNISFNSNCEGNINFANNYASCNYKDGSLTFDREIEGKIRFLREDQFIVRKSKDDAKFEQEYLLACSKLLYLRVYNSKTNKTKRKLDNVDLERVQFNCNVAFKN